MNESCPDTVELLEKYFLTSSYAIEFAVGAPGNLLVVLGYICCFQKWHSYQIYLFNLAVSDLIFLCTLPRLSYLYANKQQETNAVSCVLNRYVLHVNLYSSILFMVWLSMDRFLLIKYPFRNHALQSRRAALLVTGVSWIAVNVEVAPMITLMIHDLKRNNQCQDFASLRGDIHPLGYSLGLTLTGYIIPLLGLCVFSYHIAQLLRDQDRSFQRRTPVYKKPLRFATSATAMFLVLYTPYHVLRNIRIGSQDDSAGLEPCTRIHIESLYILSRPLAFLHSVINPVFYFHMGDRFRELLLSKFRKLTGKTERLTEVALSQKNES